MTAVAPDSESSSDFVDVQLDQEPVPSSMAPPPGDGASALAVPGQQRFGWRSQVSLVAEDGAASASIGMPRLRQISIQSASSPNLGALATAARRGHDGVCADRLHQRLSQAAAEPGLPPPRRLAEGRYRSRFELANKSPLRPLLLSNEPRAPHGVQYDSSVKAGVSLTVLDSSGNIMVVRSPNPLQNEFETFPMRRATSDRHASAPPVPPASQRRASLSAPHSSRDAQVISAPVSPTQRVHHEHDAAGAPRGTAPATVQEKGTAAPATTEGGAAAQGAPVPPAPSPPSAAADVPPPSQPDTTAAPASGSLTRMQHLPPKPRREEAKHLSDFSAMMRASKAAEKKRVVSRSTELRQRQEAEDQARAVWNRDIMPCWTRAREDAALRRLWWNGIPQALRPRLWPRACGNQLMLSHDLFPRALGAVSSLRQQGQMPAALYEAIRDDTANTLPSLRLFDEQSGPLWHDLMDVLCAFTYVRADEASQRESQPHVDLDALHQQYTLYVPGTAHLAATLLMTLTPSTTLLVLLNLVATKPWLAALYKLERIGESSATLERVQGYERVLSALVAERLPDIYANLHKTGIRPHEYVRPWIQTLLVPWLDIDTVVHLWDIMYVIVLTQPPRGRRRHPLPYRPRAHRVSRGPPLRTRARRAAVRAAGPQRRRAARVASRDTAAAGHAAAPRPHLRAVPGVGASAAGAAPRAGRVVERPDAPAPARPRTASVVS